MKVLRPLKAIRAKCLDCCCGSSHEVALCPTVDCPLWAYRKGHRPTYEEIFKVEQFESKVSTSVYVEDEKQEDSDYD